MLHTSGLKHFADVGIRSTSTAVGPYDATLGKRIGIGSADFTETIQDLLGYNRVDTIYDYDKATDGTADGKFSTLIEFENKTLSDYFKAKSNEVLVLDDINKLNNPKTILKDLHPELENVQPGDELMTVNFGEENEEDPLYKSLKNRIDELNEERYDDEDEDEDDDGDVVVRT